MRQPWLPSVTGWKPVLHSRDARPPSPARHRIHRRGVAWVERAHRVHYRGGDRPHGINKLLKADELRPHLRQGIRRARGELGGVVGHFMDSSSGQLLPARKMHSM